MPCIQIPDRFSIGDGQPLTLIGGPCVIESEDFTLKMADAIRTVCDRLQVQFIFKSSFDKANRTSVNSFRGQSIEEGLAILQKVKDKVGVPVLTDIHESYQAATVAEVVDVPAWRPRPASRRSACSSQGSAACHRASAGCIWRSAASRSCAPGRCCTPSSRCTMPGPTMPARTGPASIFRASATPTMSISCISPTRSAAPRRPRTSP